jgi:hypothetical protein
VLARVLVLARALVLSIRGCVWAGRPTTGVLVVSAEVLMPQAPPLPGTLVAFPELGKVHRALALPVLHHLPLAWALARHRPLRLTG